MSSTNLGEFEITLNGERAALRYTLRAAREINGVFGSYTAAIGKLIAYDLSAFVAIVAAGLGKTSKEVEQAVFENGMPNLIGPLSQYVTRLGNGGKEPDAEAKPASGEA